jgi:hypothetical protein
VASVNVMRLSSRKGAHAGLSSPSGQEIRAREMAKKCELSELIRLILRIQRFLLPSALRLRDRWRTGEWRATAAGRVTRSDYFERAESFERLVDRAATDVAVEEVPDLFSGEAVGRSLQNLAGAIGNGVSDSGAEEGRGRRPNGLSSPIPERLEDTAETSY